MGRVLRRLSVRLGMVGGAYIAGRAVYSRLWHADVWRLEPPPPPAAANDPPPSPMQHRKKVVNKMKLSLSSPQCVYDLVVVGGGACGLYAAVDAASRGLSVALLEAGDFGSGVSSLSPKVLLGSGFRQFQKAIRQKNWAAVKAAVTDISDLRVWQRCAPRSVITEKVEFLIPCVTWAELLEGAISVVALSILGTATAKAICHSFTFNCNSAVERLFPFLSPVKEEEDSVGIGGGGGGSNFFHSSQLKGALLIKEAVIDDAAACISLAQTAERLGVDLLSYCPVVGTIMAGDSNDSASAESNSTSTSSSIVVVVVDKQQGRTTKERAKEEEEVFKLKTRVIVNCAGAWAERCHHFNPSLREQQIFSRFGVFSQLVTQLPTAVNSSSSIAKKGAVMFNSTMKAAPNFSVVPWKDGLGLIGFHAQPVEGNRVAHSQFLDGGSDGGSGRANSSFLSRLGEGQSKVAVPWIEDALRRSSMEGFLRPNNGGFAVMSAPVALLHPPSHFSGAANVLRDDFHVISGSSHGVVTVVGGTWLAVRRAAAAAVDAAISALPQERRQRFQKKASITHRLGLVDASNTATVGVDSPPLLPSLPRYTWAHVDAFVKDQFALSVVDVVARRTPLAYAAPQEVREQLVRPLAVRMGQLLQWDRNRVEEECAEAEGFLESIQAKK